MKKILLSFFMCMLAIIGMQAEKVTISVDFSKYTGNSTQYAEETHKLHDDLEITIKDCHINTQLRIYSSNANNGYVVSNKLPGAITNMTFNAGYKKDVLNVYGSTNGTDWTLVGEGVSVTSTSYKDYSLDFTGDYTYFKLDVKGTQQIRVATMSVTYETTGEGGGEDPEQPGEGGGDVVTVAAPSITPESCTFDESVNVTIANNADGATVYYSLNGGEFAEYTAPITVTETTTVSAKAVKDEVESEVVSATYTKLASYANIAAFIDAAPAQEAILAGAVTVTYQNGDNLYVKDETGSILIYKATGKFNSGDKLTGVKGKYELYNGLPEIINATLPEAVAGDAVEPVVMTAEEVKALTAKDYSRYIKLENVEFDKDGKTIAGIAMYNKFKFEFAEGGTDCTVVGLVCYHTSYNLQIIPISIEVNESGEDPVDPTPDPTEPVYGWVLVKDASTLAVGDKVVIAATESQVALSTTQNKNNRGQADVTKNGETITFGDGVQELTLEAGTKAGTWAFNTGNGYLYAASSGSNYLKTQTTNNDNGSWLITIANGGVASVIAQGANTNNDLKYNSTNRLFSCYGSGNTQKAVSLYRKYVEANITAGMYYLVPGEWENEDLALYGVKFVNVSTGEYKWVQGFLNNHYVYFQLDGEGEYTHMAFYRIANTGNTTATVIKDDEWDAIEIWANTSLLTYTAPANGKIMRYIVDESKWEEVEIGSGVNRVEMAGGIGYAYGVVSAEGAIEVYNVNGAVVARGNDTIDLRGLGRGVYIIRNGNQVRKVVR